MAQEPLAAMKKLFFYTFLVVFSAGVTFTLGEVAVRWLRPSPYMFPRYRYDPKYGFGLFEGVRMEHGQPGKYRFLYTINELGYRGEPVPIAPESDIPNIVVLGDSYAFGMGVDDGEEFPAVLARKLRGSYHVVNLGTPGWGLTQEIRRYYDFGSLYRPRGVVLQFCSNDPDNNFTHKVTKIENGQFVFVDHPGRIHVIKRYLSKSLLQRSQLYNFFRSMAFRKYQDHVVGVNLEAVPRDPAIATPKQKVYVELLELFAKRLRDEHVRLVMISVNRHLDRVPYVKRQVERLDEEGLLQYVEVDSLFEYSKEYKSAEGHWGAKAHAAIADALADVVRSWQP